LHLLFLTLLLLLLGVLLLFLSLLTLFLLPLLLFGLWVRLRLGRLFGLRLLLVLLFLLGIEWSAECQKQE